MASDGEGAESRPGSVLATRHPSPVTHLARIEVGIGELPKFAEGNLPAKVAEALKKIGYAHVTLDLLGYRRGSANEFLKSSAGLR